jgi:hypothetical protein
MAGSDGPGGLMGYGWSLHRELEMLVDAGSRCRRSPPRRASRGGARRRARLGDPATRSTRGSAPPRRRSHGGHPQHVAHRRRQHRWPMAGAARPGFDDRAGAGGSPLGWADVIPSVSEESCVESCVQADHRGVRRLVQDSSARNDIRPPDYGFCCSSRPRKSTTARLTAIQL